MVSGQNIHKLSAKSDLLGAQVRAPPPPLLVSAYKNHKCLEGLGEARSNRGRTAGEPRVEQATSEGDGASEGIPPCRPPDSAPERGRAQNGRWLACARVRLAATRSRVKQKARGLSPWPAVFNGASNRTRTDDPRFTRAVLYQLSYAGVRPLTLQKVARSFKCVFLDSVALHYNMRSTPRTRRSKSSEWASATARTLSCVTSAAPDSLAASVRPRTFMSSALAMMTSHTVDIPT